uniref:Mads box protein n=1 Tax=Solanum tuberosum TaxID=4113 RepID=M0ZZJ7_SOLTU
MKLVESKDARYVTFSKRKLSLFNKAIEFSSLTGADVGIFLISPSGRPYSYASTSIENITHKFLEWKLENPNVVDQDQADEGKSNVFKTFDDLYEEVQIMNEKEKNRKWRYKILYPGSQVPPDKQRLEKLVAHKLRLEKIKEEANNYDLTEKFEFDLNVVPSQDEGESSGTH